MKVAIVGAGSVGLVSGACLASLGHQVTCVDVDAERVAAIEAGRTPFFEAGLEELLERTVPERLQATTDLAAAVVEAEVTIIAVGTPFDGSGSDLSQVEAAARAIGAALAERQGYQLVIVKSTVLPGTTDGLVRPLLEEVSGRRAGVDFGVAMNPEFLREGQAVSDSLHPDRIVMGGSDELSWRIQEELYAPLRCPDLLRTSNATAEMIKYSSNALLATAISFSNEIGNLCATLDGVDVTEVLRGVHLDKRLSPILEEREGQARTRVRPGFLTYLMAGCGFGGSCLPKDVDSLVAFGEKRGVEMGLLRATLAVNRAQSRQLIAILERHFASLEGVPVAVLGLAFKPGTSDVRETPALPVIEALRQRGAVLRLFDPVVRGGLFTGNGVAHAADLPRAVEGAAAVVVLTSWPEFEELPAHLEQLPEPPLVVDGRRMFDRERIARYDGIGLGRR